MLEITADDIALLSETDLRTLIGRLCEEELRRRQSPTAAVTYGGDQKASDGGLDVRVNLPPGGVVDGFIPRANTGFQVKRSDMPAAKIRNEMRPKKVLRKVIRDLAKQSGAYIIVSSRGSTSDSVLQARRAAMRQIAGRTAGGLFVDFYDRQRVATWLRTHPGLFPWIRECTGKPMTGWQSYGAWAYDPQGEQGIFLVDDAVRLRTPSLTSAPGMSIAAGFQHVRSLLREPRSAVRLVGLSGVGKTRFVQALFDARLGTDALSPSAVLYANLAEGPSPPPLTVARDLIGQQLRAILVVDNCGTDLHSRLVELCRVPESQLSVITIEYDIQDDEPGETHVIKLEPSSDDLIEKLIAKRFPKLSPTNAQTIARFSGGNARIAFAIASRVGARENVALLTDTELFERLFRQRREHDGELYRAAQACALVYSFQTEDTGPGSELARLGNLVELPGQRMYRLVAELQQRDVAQRRSVWRAVLPQAIANRLATTALQNIPLDLIDKTLVSDAPERLRKSFAHRLGYLHESLEAQRIVTQWLAPDGLLGNLAQLTDDERKVFEHVAPAVPTETLGAIERALRESSDDTLMACTSYLQLLRSLAYESDLFDRAARFIARLVLARDDGHGKQQQDVFTSLFSLCLSGTNANVEQRLKVVKGLLESPDPKEQALGVRASRASLEALHFMSIGSFDFGGHSRDFGYWPQTEADVQAWFRATLGFATAISCSDRSSAAAVRSTIADAFRGLWLRGGIHEDIAATVEAIAQTGFWQDGWIAVRQTIHFDGKGMPAPDAARLAALEARLAPTNLVDRVRAIVLPDTLHYAVVDALPNEPGDDVELPYARANDLARTLGASVAADPSAFAALLPDLVRHHGLLWEFGLGLANGASDRLALWNDLARAFGAMPLEQRRDLILRGYLYGVASTEILLAQAILDAAIADEELAPWYPSFQTVVIDDTGVQRLRRSLDAASAKASSYGPLAWGTVADAISPLDLEMLLCKIAALPDGSDTALEILHSRFHAIKDKPVPPELIRIGRNLLGKVEFRGRNVHDEYRLGVLSKTCLTGPDGAEAARSLCRRFREAVWSHQTHPVYHESFVRAVMGAQPHAALDGFCGGTEQDLTRGIRLLQGVSQVRGCPLDSVPEDELLRWCGEGAEARYSSIAGTIRIATPTGNEGRLAWTSTARRLLDQAPAPVAVLRAYIGQFGHIFPGEASAVERHLPLLDEYTKHDNSAVAEFATNERARLQAAIATARHEERVAARDRDERFE
jgi:hypothetical protein